MSKLSALVASSVFAFSLVAGTSAAHADPKHCPPGHEKKGWCSNNDGRYGDRRDEQRAYNEGYRDGKRDAIRYGDRTYTDYEVIRDYSRYGLTPPPDGQYYANLDGDVVLVMAATQLIQSFVD